MAARRVEVPGSEKKPVHNAREVGDRPADEMVVVTIRVRHKKALPKRVTEQLTPREYEETYGASKEDMAKVVAFAKSHGLEVIEKDAAKRKIAVRGPVDKIAAAFGTQLKTYAAPEGEYRGREGSILIPEELAGVVVGVFGLDNRPVAKPHFRVTRFEPSAIVGEGFAAAAKVTAHALGVRSFSPVDLAKRYFFPKHVTGKGQTVAIIELGGGFRPAELTKYFKKIGVAPAPKVSVASFPGAGKNTPGTDPLDPDNPDVEVMLDIQVAAGVAPGARFVVYFAPNGSGHSFTTAVSAAIHDKESRPSVISISWGGPESAGPEPNQFEADMNDLIQAAAQLGITVCIAAGDNASADFAADNNAWDHHAHVDFPAASPFALSCGGTRINPDGTSPSEVVWHPGPNDGTGGGVSRVFDLPDYQKNAKVPKRKNPAGPVRRGVPDVAGNAAQESGYLILCDGQWFPDATAEVKPVGGTSAVAPLWAGLIALLNEALGKPLGFVNPMLYKLAGSSAFSDIRAGNNGDYKAGAGWDACTGLGVPNGQALLAALQGLAKPKAAKKPLAKRARA
jgi:kumamolisin